MKAKSKWTIGFLGLGALWTAFELYAIHDSSDDTIPLTSYIINYIPWYVGYPLIVAFGCWLAYHFGYWYAEHERVKRK